MLFLYDADCGFCTTCVTHARRIFPRVEYRASHSVDLEALGLTPAKVAQRAYLIRYDASGTPRVVGGGQAITGLLASRGPGGRAAAALLRLGLLRIPIEAVYALIARNRHKLPSGTTSCTLHIKE